MKTPAFYTVELLELRLQNMTLIFKEGILVKGGVLC